MDAAMRTARGLLCPARPGALGVLAAALVLGLSLCAAGATQAQDAGFRDYVERLWPTARAKGVSRATFERAFAGVEPDPEVWRKAEYQPEYVKPMWQYLVTAVSDTRIEKGTKLLAQYKDLLDAIETTYHVDRHVVVAIWGMETSYGEYFGKHNVIQALATLGYRGARQSFGRQQLIAALEILERGDVAPDRMMGSWAGAMGHTQFIPTTYNAHAVDFDGDGRRDIWDTIADALASTANYLRVSKWRFGETWGYEVVLPPGFNHGSVNKKTVKTLAQWQALGIKRVRGLEFPRPDDGATFMAPAGANGPAFLLVNNFRSILRYNTAPAYALAVGHLSDRIRGFGPFEQSWPFDDKLLVEQERIELQRLLAAKGYEIGEIDGVVGLKTETAVREFQRAKGLPVDGFPTFKLLERLRADG